MSWRALLVLAVATGVADPVRAASEPAATTSAKKASAKEASAKKRVSKKRVGKKRVGKKRAGKKLAKKKHRKKKKKLIARTPSRSSLRNTKNMPRGYAWPPTAEMRAVEKACQARLDELGVSWKPATTEGRIVAAMTVEDGAGAMTIGGITYTSAYRKGPHKVDCQLVLALEQFGTELHALGVRQIEFGSIYRWTNVRVNGETKNFLSRHALGIAMDINAFTDDAGREIVVKTDYPAGDPLLLAVEAAVNASGRFRILLTPKNDPVSHHDHFHLEVAVDYTALVP